MIQIVLIKPFLNGAVEKAVEKYLVYYGIMI